MGRKLMMVSVLIFLFCDLTLGQTVAPVKVKAARITSIFATVQGYGTIEPLPEDNIPLTVVSPMRILEITVKPGEEVKKGELVVKLQRDHSLDAAVDKAKISMEKDSIDYNRAITLYDSGVIPRVKLEDAKNDFDISRADYDLQKKQLDYAIQNSELRSPINGVVTSVNGEVGQIADPAAPILRIVNLQHMIAIIGTEIEEISKIRVGQSVNVTIPNLPNSPVFKGKVSKLNREIDPATQLINVWVSLNNQDEFLQPGMFAEAGIIVKQDSSALTIPRSAVLSDSKGAFVFVIRDSTAHKIRIKTGIQNDSLVQVLQGMNKGEPVVYQGNYELEDSMKVKVEK
jgi:membrane fusion protein, multidrug efflux system